MPQSTTPQSAAQINELAAQLQQDNSPFSEFETKFISEQIARIEQYGDDTHFSEKQAALIEKIHAERVRGEVPPVVEKLVNPTALEQLGNLAGKLAIDIDDEFSAFEAEFINNQIKRRDKTGDATTFSEKQAALIERMHAEKIRGEKVEKPKNLKAKPN